MNERFKGLQVYINGELVDGIGFVFDGCHKFYIVKNLSEWEKANEEGYKTLYAMEELRNKYSLASDTKFINSFDLKTTYAYQFEKATINIYDYREM